jgi:membrane protein
MLNFDACLIYASQYSNIVTVYVFDSQADSVRIPAPMKYAATTFDLLKQTFKEWSADDAPRLAAALSYYTAFSLAPLLIVIIAVVGIFFGEEAARGEIVARLTSELGRDNAAFIEEIVVNASSEENSGVIATIVGLVALLLGASGVFGQLQSSLNIIWDVEKTPSGIWNTIQRRLLSFGMIIVIGFLLLVSLVVSSVIAALDAFVMGIVPGMQLVMQAISFIISFGVVTFLFAMIYKYLPDVEIKWRDVIVGAAFTSLLFNIGRLLLAIYLGRATTASTYGAAGSLAVLLLWVYYSAQIVMFGAEFTQVYAKHVGSKIIPDVAAEAQKAASEDALERKIQPIPDERKAPLPLTPVSVLELEAAENEPKVVIKREYQGWNPRYVFVAATAFIGGLIGINVAKEDEAPSSDETVLDEEDKVALTMFGTALLAASTLLSGLFGWFMGRKRDEAPS